MFDRNVAITFSPHSAPQRWGSIHKCLTLHLILAAVGYPLVSHKVFFTEQTLIVSNKSPHVLRWQTCWAFTVYCYCFASREAMLLGLASAAVQRASAGRSGRSCQQADGQVCSKVSTEMIFPVRHSKTMVGKSWALIVRWSIFTHSDWGGGWANQSYFTWQLKLAFNRVEYNRSF